MSAIWELVIFSMSAGKEIGTDLFCRHVRQFGLKEMTTLIPHVGGRTVQHQIANS
jgi:hypothetical protein